LKTTSLDLRSLALLVSLAAVWGGSFIFAELALREVPPLTITLHRVVWAVPALWAVLALRGQVLPRTTRFWLGALGMGLLNNALPFSLIFWGQQQIDAGLAAILNATTAMFGAVVAGLLLPDESLTRNKLAGAVLGLVGVVIVMGPKAFGAFDPANLAQLAVLAAALSYAFASVWGKRMLGDHPPLVNATGMLISAAVLMVPLVLLLEGVPRLDLTVSTLGGVGGAGAAVDLTGLRALFCHSAAGGGGEPDVGDANDPTLCNRAWRAAVGRGSDGKRRDWICGDRAWVCGDRWTSFVRASPGAAAEARGEQRLAAHIRKRRSPRRAPFCNLKVGRVRPLRPHPLRSLPSHGQPAAEHQRPEWQRWRSRREPPDAPGSSSRRLQSSASR